MPSNPDTPLSTLLSQVLVAYTIELDNEFERRFARAGGRARVVLLVMWSNFMRFVADGIIVGELPAATGARKPRVLSTLGGMERWRYVTVGPEGSAETPTTKRDGFGSARGVLSTWVVRLTPDGRKAEAIWRALFDEIDARWAERFGAAEIDELTRALRAVVDATELQLPEYMPIVGGSNGMRADLPSLTTRGNGEASGPLCALLAQALLTYTLDFERESTLSLPLGANVVRVLGEDGVLVRDIPSMSGISKEATSMALNFLVRSGCVAVAGTSVATKLARLTPEGRALRGAGGPLHAELERRWDAWFGGEGVARLRSSLERLLERRDGTCLLLSRGLEPYPDGWRASKQYVVHTQAVIDNPTAGLPHYPMVLHRGGWPDGF